MKSGGRKFMEKENKIKVIDKRKKGWFMFPNDFLNGYAKEVGWQGQVVYLALSRHADGKRESYPSLRYLALELGISIDSVKRGVKRLKEKDLIKVERRGKTQSNVYTLLDKSDWKPAFRWFNKKKKE